MDYKGLLVQKLISVLIKTQNKICILGVIVASFTSILDVYFFKKIIFDEKKIFIC